MQNQTKIALGSSIAATGIDSIALTGVEIAAETPKEVGWIFPIYPERKREPSRQ